MSRLVTVIVSFVLALFATPVLANDAEGGTGKVVWIALGVTFLGAFVAIFSSLAAALAAKKNKTKDET